MYSTLTIMLDWYSRYYILRPGEVVCRRGIITREEKTYLLKHVESITCNQNFWERLFNYGTISLYNPLLNQQIDLTAIKNPNKYKQAIESAMPELEELKQELEEKNGIKEDVFKQGQRLFFAQE